MRRLAALLLLAPVGIAACGGGGGSPMSGAQDQRPAGDPEASRQRTVAAAPEAPAEKPSGTAIALRESDFGAILFDGSRQAIYLFEKEKGPRSECYGPCAEAWPPVLTDGPPSPGKGIDAAMLGAIDRHGGGRQVTYAGHPLYYYADDPAGQVLCNGVVEYGGRWAVLGAGGQAAG
jgi:predicted lipoprotein with Yx(FWY)xxD motif